MPVRDWIELGLLVVVTILMVGRWIEAREQRETSATDDRRLTRQDLLKAEQHHALEHDKLWHEIERQRDRWHQEFSPWQRAVVERLATLDGQLHSATAAIVRLEQQIERLRS